MSDQGVEPGTIAVHATRKFGTEKYLIRKVPFAIGFILFGLLILYLADEDTEGRVLGLLFIGASIAFIVLALHRRDTPQQAFVELSSAGILYRLGGKDFRIPWKEVRDLRLIDIRRTKGRSLRDITAIVVSRDFYEANMPIRSWWGKGPAWGEFFVNKGETVNIGFDHEVMSVSGGELWNEIEARWRAFSGNPDVPLLQVPHLPRVRGWIGGWSPSSAQKRWGLVLLGVLALPAIYFWHWGVTSILAQRISTASASHYLGMMLEGTGVQARNVHGEIGIVRNSQVSGLGLAKCDTDVVRDTARNTLFPSFKTNIYCGSDLITVGGAPAYAVFKLVVETSQSEDWEGKMQEHRALLPARLDESELAAAFCKFGFCGGS